MMIFDDYAYTTCPGVKLAVDSFFKNKKEDIICLPSTTFIIKK